MVRTFGAGKAAINVLADTMGIGNTTPGAA